MTSQILQIWYVIGISLFSFFGLFFINLFASAARRMKGLVKEEFLNSKNPPLYYRLQRFFLHETKIETLLFCTTTAAHILRIVLFLLCFAFYFRTKDVASYLLTDIWQNTTVFLQFIGFILTLIFLFIILLDLVPRLIAYYFQNKVIRFSSPIASFYLLVFSPVSFFLYKMMRLILPKGFLTPFAEQTISTKEKLFEVISEFDENMLLNDHDKKLLQSALTFRDRIVREVMVPRVDLFCLPHDTSIRHAAELLQKEGYSRVPVYKNTQDHILGVLMYKDLLAKYMEFDANSENRTLLDAPVEDVVKNVIYTPETKKISMLLQDFLKKQNHLAVVVDEYGGTAGVVTIEDILEEIVGEIADEYDEEEKQFWPLQRGGWIVDGRMNLIDLEEELGIKLEQEGDYDTVAGYVYYRLGTIPKKGTILDQDDFHIEILSSGDRFVEKVKITSISKKRNQS